jgi:hypothetical protein
MRKLLVIAAVAGFALAAPSVSYAADQAEAAAARLAGKTAGAGPRAINNQTAVACNLCFTCGGDWTVFAGSFTPVGNNPTERGAGCSGALQTRTDSRPFLCCR